MKNYNLASIILSSDELKDIQNEINELETKKKELERKIRISDMVSQFIKQILSEGKPVKDGKDWVIKAEVEDDFCYCTKSSDIDRIKIVKNAYQREDDCEVLREIFENCGFKYFFFTETKNEERNYLNQTINYGHIIITQILSIPLAEYERLIKDLKLNTAIEDKNKIYFKVLEKR